MSQEFAYADLLILALVAGFILLRLRAIMGQHNDLPEQRQDSLFSPNEEHSNVIDLAPVDEEDVMPPDETEHIARDDSQLATALKEIRSADPSFHGSKFLDGAKSAFEMILQAYCQADRKTLKHLLSSEMYDEFNQAIKQHKEDQSQEDITLVAINSARIAGADVTQRTIRITVEFVSEQISVTRDKDGEIIGGDPSNIETVEDQWVFERDIRSQDPNWRLVETDAG